MTPARRIALVSVVAAVVLIVVKLATGLATGSLGLLSEAAHSGTDLAAAILTFFAVGVAVRPADSGHPYGHGKAEHLAALAEASVLVVVSLVIAASAIGRLAAGDPPELDLSWWAFAAVALVMAIDTSRVVVSWRGARRYESAALATNALHFASDLGGSAAVVVGLVAASTGHPDGDSAAALLVAALVLLAAARLIRQNVDVLMDRTPASADEAARRAIEALAPGVELRRLRMRRAAGRHFADIVIGVAPGGAVGQGHAAADAVEEAVEEALPGADVVVHVEPRSEDAALRDRALAAAARVREVREIHNVTVLHADDRTEISLHLKLPGSLPLVEAHAVASDVEAAIREELPEVSAVQTHLEPLGEETAGRPLPAETSEGEREEVRRVVAEVTGRPPRDLRLYRTDDGLVAFLTLAFEPDRTLADAHARASEIEERIRREHSEIADVIVHTEP
ncbi:MAG: cation diffusion facilitator family transporter [Actinomycetota bacterium]|nr:cation diffusion facilitator family transporter [Actinomycetota bacterium]